MGKERVARRNERQRIWRLKNLSYAKDWIAKRTPEQKTAARVIQKLWRARNPEKLKASQERNKGSHKIACERWWRNNPGYKRKSKPIVTAKTIANRKIYYGKNRETLLGRKKAWSKANHDRVLAYSRSWKAKNPNKVRDWNALWARSNPDKVNASQINYQHRRRERIKRQNISPEERAAAKAFCLAAQKMTSYTCCLCRQPKQGKPTIEHHIPLARDGLHIVSNLGHACKPCNASKNDKTPEEYAAYLAWRAKISARKLTARG